MVGFLERTFQGVADFWELRGLRRLDDFQTLIAEPDGKHFGVQGEYRTNVGTPISDNDALANQWVRTERLLQHIGRDILASGCNNQFFLPPGNPQPAVLIDCSEVPGVEPSICECFGSLFWKVVVAARD